MIHINGDMDDREIVEKTIDGYLTIFGNRWNLLILYELFYGPKRFNELKRALSPITQTVLTRHLKILEDNNMIDRIEVKGNTMSVTYVISKEGFTMIPPMVNSFNWINEHSAD